MGRNKKRKDAVNRSHTQHTFPKLVADAVNAKLLTTVKGEIQQLGLRLAQNQAREMAGLVTRLTAIEQIIQEKLNISETELTEKIAAIEDTALGLMRVDEVSEGDTVRVTVVAKKLEEENYGDDSKIQITNCGKSPFTLPKEIEEELINLKTGQIVEVPFGKDMKAKVTIDRISRKIVTEEENEKTDSTQK